MTVQGQDPYVEWTQRLTSVMTWDEHQFSFYFHKKVAGWDPCGLWIWTWPVPMCPRTRNLPEYFEHPGRGR